MADVRREIQARSRRFCTPSFFVRFTDIPPKADGGVLTVWLLQIMNHLYGFENVVAMRGAYEDAQNVHLVMEVCSGGETQSFRPQPLIALT